MSEQTQLLLCYLAAVAVIALIAGMVHWLQLYRQRQRTAKEQRMAVKLAPFAREYRFPVRSDLPVDEREEYSVVVRWQGPADRGGDLWSVSCQGVVYDRLGSPIDERAARQSAAELPETYRYQLPLPCLLQLPKALEVAHDVVVPTVRLEWERQQRMIAQMMPPHEQDQ
ncbi:hypothetical protein M8C13_32350 [Crossiella sp. SN42]|uniref:hypothetical protein n=1 Tax=Crossiella sp. SN42 TaxID=2944808 RepID=UPI00207C7514|nr:hypothetical protein [Crossiella sp. SN42]MCO1580455.1 hypothetical protein [Crossiella sp. SN42]